MVYFLIVVTFSFIPGCPLKTCRTARVSSLVGLCSTSHVSDLSKMSVTISDRQD